MPSVVGGFDQTTATCHSLIHFMNLNDTALLIWNTTIENL